MFGELRLPEAPRKDDMAGIDHLLLDGETVEREERFVRAHLSGGRRATGKLYLTDRRMIFRKRLFGGEIVQDVPYGTVVDVSYKANFMSAAHLTITTADGGTTRFAVKYDHGPAVLNAIRAHQ